MEVHNSLNSKSIRGMLIGCAVMFGFGILWIVVGLSGGRFSPGWVRIGLAAAGGVLAAWISLFTIRYLRGHQRAAPAPPPEQAMLARRIGRRFGRINAVQWGAIIAAIIALNVIHRTGFIAPAIAVIVGIHFLPLAALFRQPSYYATGTLGCIIGVIGFLIADDAARLSVVGLSFGLLLWLTTIAVLVKSQPQKQVR
jgi:hypothetical protein